MLKLLVEFIGTFVFFSVILKHGKALPIAIALAAAIFFGGHISGGHFNPGVTVMMYLAKKISQPMMLKYIIAQMLAAFAAVKFAA